MKERVNKKNIINEIKNKVKNAITINKTFSYIFSFLLVISILVSFFLNLMSITILSEDYITSRLIESDYYSKTSETIKNEVEGYIAQSGFDRSIIENVFTEENITNDINSVIHSLYNNNKYEINTSLIETNLNNNIVKYIETNDITLDIKQKSSIKSFTDVLMASYSKNIFPRDIVDPIAETIMLLDSFLTRYGAFIYSLPYIIVLCMIISNINKIVTILKYISISILSSGIFLFIAYVLLMKSIKIGEISIFTQNISDIFNILLVNIFNQISTFCVIFASIGLVLTIIFAIIEDKFGFVILDGKSRNGSKWLYKY